MVYNREKYLDVVSAIMLIFMMLCHITACDLNFINNSANFFYMFMPWFFFKNGMFINKEKIRNTNLFVLLKRDSYRLLLPFVVWGIAGSLIQIFFVVLHHESVYKYLCKFLSTLAFEGRPYGNPPLWFLFSLFLCRQMIVIAVKLHINLFVISIISFLCACLCNYYCFHQIQWIGVSLCGLYFVCLGNLMYTMQFKRYVLSLSILFYILFISLGGTWVDMSSNMVLYGSYILWISSCAPGIIIVNNIFKFLYAKTQSTFVDKIVNVFCQIGKDSMIYYVAHWLVIMSPAHAIMNLFSVENQFIIYLIKIMLCIVVLPMVGCVVKTQRLKWTVGI